MESLLSNTGAPVDSLPDIQNEGIDDKDDPDLEDMVEVSIPEDSDANPVEKEDEANKKKTPVWRKPEKKKKAGKKPGGGGGKQKQKSKQKQKQSSESGPSGDQAASAQVG